MKNNLPEKLICPLCKSPKLALREICLYCENCKKKFLFKNGFLDFTSEKKREKFSLSQSMMELSPVVFVYEKLWRPLITFPFSDYRWEKKKIIEMLELNPHCSILDIACGTGNFTRLIADHIANKNSSILGMDLSEPMLKKAAASAANIQYSHLIFLKADVADFPFGKESFERIHCSGALHLFPSPKNVIQSVERTLKPGGIFAGSTYIKNKSVGKFIKNALEPILKFHWFDPDELKGLAMDAGLVGWEHQIKKQGIVFRVRKP